VIYRRLIRLLLPALVLLAGPLGAGHVRADGRFNAPLGVAVDRYGNVYVADSGDSQIIKLSPAGVVLHAWQEHGTDFVGGTPTGMGVDRSGNVYVSDSENDTILKFGPRGGLNAQWAHNGDGEFNNPQGLSLGNRSNVFVANSDNDTLEKLGPTGYVLNAWPVSDDSGTAASPQWIAVGADGTIFTTVQSNNGCDYCGSSAAVQKRASNGDLLATWPTPDNLAGIAVGGRGNIFVVDQDANAVLKLSPAGQVLARWTPDSMGGFAQPTGVALDARGDIYVTDTGNNQIIKLSSTGNVLAVWR
jgi:DNA-binding beta-propeller fold protein YncE